MGEDRLDPRCSELRLESTPGGGFRLRSAEGGGFVIGPLDGGRRTVETSDRRFTLRLASNRPGFVLETHASPVRELARTERDHGVGTGCIAVHLEDGRFFWIVPRVDSGRRRELRGWETEGAYWIAEWRGTEWTFWPTPAGTRLAAEEIVVLLAAEILAASEQHSMKSERSPE